MAAGADAIVLDVTSGDGAFMKKIEEASRLANTMTIIGKLAHRQTVSVICDMCEHLVESIGNRIEVEEAMETLNGTGPEDLLDLCYALGCQWVV